MLLAVDLGLRTGLAWFDERGALVAARSHHLQNANALGRLAWSVTAEWPVTHCVVEGDRRYETIWRRCCDKRGIELVVVAPETWRAAVMPARDRRTGQAAKKTALKLARAVMAESDGVSANNVRHDTAEAILIGVWAARELGWS